MISDILYETVEQVNRYLRDFPHAYPPTDPMTIEIKGMRDWAKLIQIVLDTPPGFDWTLAPTTGWTENPWPQAGDLDMIVNTADGPIIVEQTDEARWDDKWAGKHVLAIRVKRDAEAT